MSFFIGIDIMEINTYVLSEYSKSKTLIIETKQIRNNKVFKEEVKKLAKKFNAEILGTYDELIRLLDDDFENSNTQN